MSASPDDELVRELSRTDPDRFVVQRDATVKRLKAEGRKEEAAALAKLRRPKAAEHALNVVADRDPDLVGTWAAAVDAAERAQAAAIGRGDASTLSAALAEVRSTSARITDAAVSALGEAGPAQRTAIADLVRASTNTAGAARLRAGLVGAPFEPSEEFFPGTEHVTVRPRSARPAEPPARRAARPMRAAAAEGTDVALRQAAEGKPGTTTDADRAAAAEAARAAAEAVADEARRREAALAAHRAAIQRAETRLAKAAARHAKVERDLRLASEELHDARAALSALERTDP